MLADENNYTRGENIVKRPQEYHWTAYFSSTLLSSGEAPISTFVVAQMAGVLL